MALPDSSPIEAIASAVRTAFQTVTLTTLAPPPLFIRGTFFDPVMRKPRPLPPHSWTLARTDGSESLFSTISDGAGICVLPLDLTGGADAAWVLSWKPEFGGDAQGSSGEIWVDVDQVDPDSEIFPAALSSKAWVPRPDTTKLEKRSLVRLVAMDSKAKLATGGFELVAGVDAPDGTPGKTFATASLGVDGTLLQGSFLPLLRKFGDRQTPWDLQVDFNWFQTWIALRYYDLAQKQSLPVPPGLVVWAKNAHGTIVGAGVGIDASFPIAGGTFYVLHMRTRAQSADVHYTFLSPTGATIFLDAEAIHPNPTTTIADDSRGDPRRRYLLPSHWHSHGMAAWTETPGAKSQFQIWEDLANSDDPIRMRSTTRAFPLNFHLDDTVLVDESGIPVPFPETDNYVTALDHLLRIRSPMEAMPHVTAPSLEKEHNYLFAPIFVFVDQEGIELFTRIFNHEGRIFDLRERRISGAESSTRALGARMAVASDHPLVDRSATGATIAGAASFQRAGAYELHLIDTFVDDWKYSGSTARLFHLLVYFSVFVNKNDTTDEDVSGTLANLDAAARRWSPGHPAAPEMAGKAYAIVPSAGVLDGAPVILVRHFFGHFAHPRGGKVQVILNVSTKILTGFYPSERVVRLIANHGAAPVIEYAPSGLTPAGDPDGPAQLRFTMAHEFGHVTGLPDEYPEPIDRSANVSLARVQQVEADGGPARPYTNDPIGLMMSNHVPRLRYLWHHVHALNHEPIFASVLGSTVFVAEHRAFPVLVPEEQAYRPARLRYQLDAVPPFAPPGDPWSPLARRMMKGNQVELFFYQLGADESAAGALVGATGTLFEGLLLIRINFGFRPAPGGSSGDCAAAAALVQAAFPHGDWQRPVLRLNVQDERAPFRHILVLFQPAFYLAGDVPAPAVNVLVDPSNSARPSDLLLPIGARPMRPRIPATDAGSSLGRWALGLPTAGLSPNSPIVAAEMALTTVALELQQMLGDPPDRMRVWS